MNAKLQTLIQRYERLDVMTDSDCPTEAAKENRRKLLQQIKNQIANYTIELAVQGRLFFANRNGKVRQVKVRHNNRICVTKNPYI